MKPDLSRPKNRKQDMTHLNLSPRSPHASRITRCLLALTLTASTVLIQACASGTQTPRLNYDFGALPKNLEQKPLALTLSVADMNAPGSLDGNAMLYRLDYDNQQTLRSYAQHRWSMPPAQLLTYRLKSRIAAAGGTVVSVTDGVADLATLKIDLDEFAQIFTAPGQSHAQLTLRASLLKKNKLLAQRYFTFNAQADSADAPGGAKAMQVAADASISALLLWLQSVTLN